MTYFNVHTTQVVKNRVRPGDNKDWFNKRKMRTKVCMFLAYRKDLKADMIVVSIFSETHEPSKNTT